MVIHQICRNNQIFRENISTCKRSLKHVNLNNAYMHYTIFRDINDVCGSVLHRRGRQKTKMNKTHMHMEFKRNDPAVLVFFAHKPHRITKALFIK